MQGFFAPIGVVLPFCFRPPIGSHSFILLLRPSALFRRSIHPSDYYSTYDSNDRTKLLAVIHPFLVFVALDTPWPLSTLALILVCPQLTHYYFRLMFLL